MACTGCNKKKVDKSTGKGVFAIFVEYFLKSIIYILLVGLSPILTLVLLAFVFKALFIGSSNNFDIESITENLPNSNNNEKESEVDFSQLEVYKN